MQHIALSPFRGPATLAHLAAARLAPPGPAVDKWQVLTHLRAARSRFGLTDRSLSVLQALLSFLPGRSLVAGEPLVVFPSNASLAERANGLPESTLRRHLAALVAAGLIARRDSPNGKRYRTRGPCPQAFGFDLAPLRARAGDLAGLADEVRAEDGARREARATAVLLLRDCTKLTALARAEGLPVPDWTEAALDEARRQLRRRAATEVLVQVSRDLEGLAAQLRRALDPAPMSSDDARNERHQQRSIPETHDSRTAESRQDPARDRGCEEGEDRLPLALVLKACPEILTYAPVRPHGWRDLIGLANTVRAWLGIGEGVWRETQLRFGPAGAAITLAAVVQRAASIRNPGAYLRSLLQAHASGRFVPSRLIHALLGPATA